MTQLFCDVYYQAGETPSFCYRSGLCVYEEALIGGALVARGFNAAGYPLNVLTNCPTRLDPTHFAEPFAFELELNGVGLMHHLAFGGFETERTDDRLHAVLTLHSTLLAVTVRVHTVLDGTAMFERWLEIENRSDAALNISRLCPFAGGVQEADGSRYSLGYFEGDDWGEEGLFVWKPLSPEQTVIRSRFGRGRYRHPLLFINNDCTGELWFFQIAYAGGCAFAIDYDARFEGTDAATLAVKAAITGYTPLAVMKPQETLSTPSVHIGLVHGTADTAVAAMHEHARRSVLTETEPSLLVGAGMGAEHDMSVETTKAFIDQFASMGAEVFIIDAGWQNPPHREAEWGPYNGINAPDPARYPNGIAEVRDYCHQKGMKFAMWVEIERLGEYSPAYQQHPEWRQQTVFGEASKALLDFTNPEAAAWAEAELARLIEDCGMDMLRIDNNHHHTAYHTMRPTEGGLLESTVLRHCNAVNAMYRRLKARFPHVIFENCAGGGGRTDYAFMKAFHHTWVSDWQKLPRSVLITAGMTMALPPERVDRLVAGMGCHTVGDLRTHLRAAMFGHLSLNVIAPSTAAINPEQLACVRHHLDIYKTFLRPFLPTCTVYHPIPDHREATASGYTVLEVTSADRSRGAVGVFTLQGNVPSRINVKLSGADVSATYRVTLDNTGDTFEMSGVQLRMHGMETEAGMALSSELILYERLT